MSTQYRALFDGELQKVVGQDDLANGVSDAGAVDTLRIQILGSLRIWRGAVELDAGPPQQAALLAIFCARAGLPLSTKELVDLIWGRAAPPSAVNTIHKYIGSLRRVLEPRLAARRSGTYLVPHGNGYVCVAGLETLDVSSFRVLIEDARDASVGGHFELALDRYRQALGLWSGPAGSGLNVESAAMSLFAGLDAELFDASVAAAQLALSLGRPEVVIAALQLAASIGPLHETVQASLMDVLTAAGRQADALSVFMTTRTRLADELGIDPGPALQASQRRILDQTASSSDDRPVVPPPIHQPSPWSGLIGRREEYAQLWNTVEHAVTGSSGLALVEGEPGQGKTRLIEEVSAEVEKVGAQVVWGRCLDGDSVPAMWPWVQIVRTLAAGLAQVDMDEGELNHLVQPYERELAGPVLPELGAQFRLFENVVTLVERVASKSPLILVVDDLHWGDFASLQMFSHLAARLPSGAVLVGALRDRAPAPGESLSRLLAETSRIPRHRRIRLAPLTLNEVVDLVTMQTGRTLGPIAARRVFTRTAGNPFFVQEISRFLADGKTFSEEAVVRAAVPATVLDVVRGRISTFDEVTTQVLQIAALIGRDIDLAVLARAAGMDEQTCLDRVEPLEEYGLLAWAPGNQYLLCFTHDLVRESVVELTPRRSVPAMHLAIADALERVYTDDEDPVVEQLAQHLLAAGPVADPGRTSASLVRAGRCAASKSAFQASALHLEAAAQIARAAGLASLELSALINLTSITGMRVGYVGSALDLLERAEKLARRVGHERETADLLFSRWAAYSQGVQLNRAGTLAKQLLDQGEGSPDPIVRGYGLSAWGIHQWDIGNIGEAVRYLRRANSVVLDDRKPGEDVLPLRRDLQLLWPVMLALNTALHGDVSAARKLLDALEEQAGDDAYAITVWAAFAVYVEALGGDAAGAKRVAERGIAADPELSYAFLGSYHRLARCWARAVTGDDPVGAATEAEKLIREVLLDPPRSGLATWYGLLAEMHLAAANTIEARRALDHADVALDTYGQRYAEGYVLLQRARLLDAEGESTSVVRAAAERARARSVEQEAHLFANRAGELLRELTTRSSIP